MAQARETAGLPASIRFARAEVFLAGADLPADVDLLTQSVAALGWSDAAAPRQRHVGAAARRHRRAGRGRRGLRRGHQLPRPHGRRPDRPLPGARAWRAATGAAAVISECWRSGTRCAARTAGGRRRPSRPPSPTTMDCRARPNSAAGCTTARSNGPTSANSRRPCSPPRPPVTRLQCPSWTARSRRSLRSPRWRPDGWTCWTSRSRWCWAAGCCAPATRLLVPPVVDGIRALAPKATVTVADAPPILGAALHALDALGAGAAAHDALREQLRTR